MKSTKQQQKILLIFLLKLNISLHKNVKVATDVVSTKMQLI